MQSQQGIQSTLQLEPVKDKIANLRLISLLPFIGLMLGILIWLLDAAVDVYILEPDGAFWQSVFTAQPTEMWMRTVVVIVMLASSLFAQYFMRKQYQFEKLLLEYTNNLEQMVHERTMELQHLANIDALTQIYNRRKFNELFDLEMERSRRYQHPLSLALIDIDHFKQVNDQLGHQEGDLALQAIANILRNNLRKSDIYARWGGEEFIVLLSHIDTQNAIIVAEKLRHMISNVTYGDNNQTLTASFGITQFNKEDQKSTILKRADKALYKAKNDGRNCICTIE